MDGPNEIYTIYKYSSTGLKRIAIHRTKNASYARSFSKCRLLRKVACYTGNYGKYDRFNGVILDMYVYVYTYI